MIKKKFRSTEKVLLTSFSPSFDREKPHTMFFRLVGFEIVDERYMEDKPKSINVDITNIKFFGNVPKKN